MILLGIMLDKIMMKPSSMNTMPRWKVVTMDSDLLGGCLTTTASSSRVPVLATLCLLVQMMELFLDESCLSWWLALAPLSLLILLSLLWCLFSRSILTAIALWIAEVSGMIQSEVPEIQTQLVILTPPNLTKWWWDSKYKWEYILEIFFLTQLVMMLLAQSVSVGSKLKLSFISIKVIQSF